MHPLIGSNLFIRKLCLWFKNFQLSPHFQHFISLCLLSFGNEYFLGSLKSDFREDDVGFLGWWCTYSTHVLKWENKLMALTPPFVVKLANGSLAYISVLSPSTPVESRGAITVVSGRRPRATRPPVNVLALHALIIFSSSPCWLCFATPSKAPFEYELLCKESADTTTRR